VTWHAPLYSHAPDDPSWTLEHLVEPGDDEDRWNRPGEPTAYLASDPGVCLAELGRHHPPGAPLDRRRILRFEPARPEGIGGLVDLRDAAVLRALGVTRPPTVFLDRDRARALAARVRHDVRHAGLVVPSMAFLDDPERCNVVLFGERIGDLGSVLQGSSEVARGVVGPA
jgi:RES domain-containing protein